MSKQDVLEFLGAIPSYKAVGIEDIREYVQKDFSDLKKDMAMLKRKQKVSHFTIGNKCFYRGMMG